MTFFKFGRYCINLDAITYIEVHTAGGGSSIAIYFKGKESPLTLPGNDEAAEAFITKIGYQPGQGSVRRL